MRLRAIGARRQSQPSMKNCEVCDTPNITHHYSRLSKINQTHHCSVYKEFEHIRSYIKFVGIEDGQLNPIADLFICCMQSCHPIFGGRMQKIKDVIWRQKTIVGFSLQNRECCCEAGRRIRSRDGTWLGWQQRRRHLGGQLISQFSVQHGKARKSDCTWTSIISATLFAAM